MTMSRRDQPKTQQQVGSTDEVRARTAEQARQAEAERQRADRDARMDAAARNANEAVENMRRS